MGREELLRSFHHHSVGCDVAVVEGCLGLFDGHDNRTEEGSTAQVAKWLGAPVLLVLDAGSAGRSAAAVIRGCQQFDQGLQLCGVLLNRTTDPQQLRQLRDALEGTGVGLPVLGGVPKVGTAAEVRRPAPALLPAPCACLRRGRQQEGAWRGRAVAVGGACAAASAARVR
jgi:cobyrinic acid a,c-diamide synthase